MLSLATFVLVSCSKDNDGEYMPLPTAQDRIYAGGETTIFTQTSNSFNQPAPNLTSAGLEQHLRGDADFDATFVTAPAEINSGSGPIFNNRACVNCHSKDGRSPFPTDLNSLDGGFLMRVSLPGNDEHGGPRPIPGFGTQIQNHANYGYEPEAKYQVTYTSITETLADGTKVILKKPHYSLIDTYIPMPSNALLSPRLAPAVFGLGLLEANPESQILSYQDINDDNGDGISGKANYVYDEASNTMELGRFGWKANVPTVLQQCAGAYNDDMGITSYYFPEESGTGQTNGDDGLEDDPEIEAQTLNDVAFYSRTLGVPAGRDVNDKNVLKGQGIFNRIDCAKCHIPEMQTGYSEISAVTNQKIFPFSDMLLHDMGEGLADGRPDYNANGREWRTTPLWGVGLTQIVNGHTDLLHDGRAKNITQAILWHGGEAQAAKNAFKALSTKEREDLLAFIKSL